MEVKIGVQNANRELVLDSDQEGDEIEKAVTAALGEENGVLSLVDNKGRKVVVPVSKLAYVEIGSPMAGQVGFRS
ncbi:MAG TPA: DUF3107 domain-containing protein [Nocardioidaceae bacterium]|nr:DUF3107 domain-containing protein [Nocardioidaceae bacterium]